MPVIAAQPPQRLVILGHPVAHSLSPAFQNAALSARGLSLKYTLLDTPPEELADTLADLANSDAGGNVTIPHKEAVAAACSWRSEMAMRTGAVNTFWFEQGKLYGHNTDVSGVIATLVALLTSTASTAAAGSNPLKTVVLGAGGSAAAVLVALEEIRSGKLANSAMHNAQRRMQHANNIVVAARNTERAHSLLERVGVTGHVVPHTTDSAREAVRDAGLVVNCTPLGLRDDDPLPVDPAQIAKGAVLFDLVYRRDAPNNNGASTRWVRQGRVHGLVAEDGLRMLVEQGAHSFETWFGGVAPRSAMWASLGVEQPKPTEMRL